MIWFFKLNNIVIIFYFYHVYYIMTKKIKETPFFYELVQTPEDIISMANKIEKMDNKTRKILTDFIPLETFALRKDPYFNTSMRVSIGSNTQPTPTSTGTTTTTTGTSTGVFGPDTFGPGSGSHPSTSGRSESTNFQHTDEFTPGYTDTTRSDTSGSYASGLYDQVDTRFYNKLVRSGNEYATTNDIIEKLRTIKMEVKNYNLSEDIFDNNAFSVNEKEFIDLIDKSIFILDNLTKSYYLPSYIVNSNFGTSVEQILNSDISEIFYPIDEVFSIIIHFIFVCDHFKLFNTENYTKLSESVFGISEHEKFNFSYMKVYSYLTQFNNNDKIVGIVNEEKITGEITKYYRESLTYFYDDSILGSYFDVKIFAPKTVDEISKNTSGYKRFISLFSKQKLSNLLDLTCVIFFIQCFSKYSKQIDLSGKEDIKRIIERAHGYLQLSFDFKGPFENLKIKQPEKSDRVFELINYISPITRNFELYMLGAPIGKIYTPDSNMSKIHYVKSSPIFPENNLENFLYNYFKNIIGDEQIFSQQSYSSGNEKYRFVKSLFNLQTDTTNKYFTFLGIKQNNNVMELKNSFINISEKYNEDEQNNSEYIDLKLRYCVDITKNFLISITYIESNRIVSINYYIPLYNNFDFFNILEIKKSSGTKLYTILRSSEENFIMPSFSIKDTQTANLNNVSFDYYIKAVINTLQDYSSESNYVREYTELVNCILYIVMHRFKDESEPKRRQMKSQSKLKSKNDIQIDGSGIKKNEYTVPPEKLEILINEYELGNKSAIIKGEILTGLNELVMNRKISRNEFYKIKNNLKL